MTLYIPHSIFHLARLLYVRPETFGPYYVCYFSIPLDCVGPDVWFNVNGIHKFSSNHTRHHSKTYINFSNNEQTTKPSKLKFVLMLIWYIRLKLFTKSNNLLPRYSSTRKHYTLNTYNSSDENHTAIIISSFRVNKLGRGHIRISLHF